MENFSEETVIHRSTTVLGVVLFNLDIGNYISCVKYPGLERGHVFKLLLLIFKLMLP